MCGGQVGKGPRSQRGGFLEQRKGARIKQKPGQDKPGPWPVVVLGEGSPTSASPHRTPRCSYPKWNEYLPRGQVSGSCGIQLDCPVGGGKWILSLRFTEGKVKQRGSHPWLHRGQWCARQDALSRGGLWLSGQSWGPPTFIHQLPFHQLAHGPRTSTCSLCALGEALCPDPHSPTEHGSAQGRWV